MSIWPLSISDLPPPAALQGSDGLEAAGVNFLKFNVVAAGAEKFGEEAGEVGFFRLEAGDSDHVLGQIQHGGGVDGVEEDFCGVGHGVSLSVMWRGVTPILTFPRQGGRDI